MAQTENPAGALVESLIRRERIWATPRVAWACAALIWLGSLPLAWATTRGTAAQIVETWSAAALALGLLGGFTLVLGGGRCDREAALLLSFQRGGCLDEILGTRIDAREIVDGLALTTARRVAALLLPSVAFSAISALSLAAPEDRGPGMLLLCLLLVLLGLEVLVSLSYLAVANAALTSGKDERPVQSLRTLLLCASIGVPFVGFLIGVACGPVGFWVGLLSGGLWTTWLARSAALWALRRGGGLPASLRWLDLSWLLRPRRPNPWIRPWSDNAIVGREAARESHRVPFGWFGAFLARGGTGFLLGLGGAALMACGDAEAVRVAWEVLVGVLMLVLYSYSSSRAIDLVVSEHEAKTLPQLLATPMSVEDLAGGVASVAVRGVVLQYLGLAVPVLAVGLCALPSLAWLALVAESALPVLAACAGAWVGLQSAAPVPTRQEALGRSGNLSGLWLVAMAGFLTVACYLLLPHVPFRYLWASVFAVGWWGVLTVSRSLALETLAHRPSEGTVGLAPGT